MGLLLWSPDKLGNDLLRDCPSKSKLLSARRKRGGPSVGGEQFSLLFALGLDEMIYPVCRNLCPLFSVFGCAESLFKLIRPIVAIEQ